MLEHARKITRSRDP